MSSLRALISVLLLLVSLTIAAALIAGFFGSVHPAFDSFAHFRWHLAWALLVVAIPLIGSRFRLQGVFSLAFAVAALWTTLAGMGWYHNLGSAFTAPAASHKLLHLNLRYDNPDHAAVHELIKSLRPDVITLNEVADAWRPDIETLRERYPYQAVCDSSRGVGGVAILSLWPVIRPIECFDNGMLAIGSFDFRGIPVEVAALHLHWPWPFQQAEQLERIADPLSKLGDAAILAGDLNAATWSATVRKIEASSGLRVHKGIGPTWLTTSLPESLIGFVGLPIDNVFSNGDIAIGWAATQPQVGSDHLPVLVQFMLTDRTTASASPGD